MNCPPGSTDPPTKSLPTHSLPLCFQLDKTFLLPIKFACQKDPLAYTTTIKWETHPVARGHLWILRSGPVKVATVEIQKLWLLWINGYTGTPEATNSPICVQPDCDFRAGSEDRHGRELWISYVHINQRSFKSTGLPVRKTYIGISCILEVSGQAHHCSYSSWSLQANYKSTNKSYFTQ